MILSKSLNIMKYSLVGDKMSLPRYKCPICGLYFSCKGCMNNHIKKAHPVRKKEIGM